MQMQGAVFDERIAMVKWRDDVGRDPQCTARIKMYNTEQKKLQAVKQNLPVEKSTAPRWKIALSLGSRTRTDSACGWGGISIRKTIAMRR